MAGGERLESCLRDDVEVMRMRLLLLPGLGADMRLFLPQLKAFSDSVTPGWIDPEAGEGLRAYSERYLPYLVEQGHVPRAVGDVAGSMEDVGAKGEAEDGWALVGFSFGAQIALEMARLVARRSASASVAAGGGAGGGVVGGVGGGASDERGDHAGVSQAGGARGEGAGLVGAARVEVLLFAAVREGERSFGGVEEAFERDGRGRGPGVFEVGVAGDVAVVVFGSGRG